MKTLIVCSLFLVQAGLAYGQNTLPVCERTPQVRDAIVAKLKKAYTPMTCVLANEMLDTIQILSLMNKNITSLKEGDFSGLTSLKHLELRRNQLSALPEKIFWELPLVEAIDLDNNQLSTLPDGVFQNLNSLKLVHLYENNFSEDEERRIKDMYPFEQTSILLVFDVTVYNWVPSYSKRLRLRQRMLQELLRKHIK